jgi:hypothetical protein
MRKPSLELLIGCASFVWKALQSLYGLSPPHLFLYLFIRSKVGTRALPAYTPRSLNFVFIFIDLFYYYYYYYYIYLCAHLTFYYLA